MLLQFDLLTIFPEVFTSSAFKGVVGQAIAKQKILVNPINLRDFSDKKYRQIDGPPFGGGDGMVYRPEPLSKAIESITKKSGSLTIYLTPQGQVLNQTLVQNLSQKEQIILICGRYGGIDERVIGSHIDMELSIGDYVLSGGELAAMVVIDALTRLQKGILGNQESLQQDSFSEGLLEAPQFTHPRVFKGQAVPDVLLSGHHQKIADWKKGMAILRTFFRKPDLMGENITQKDRDFAKKLFESLSIEEKRLCGLPDSENISL